MRILIVDDDAVVRHILSAFLNGYSAQFLPPGDSGVDLAVATNGNEGLQTILAAIPSNSLPNVVFLDLQLMDMTGVEVMEKVEERLGKGLPPIIAMSAQPLIEVQRNHPNRDWSLFLQKPFVPEQVVAMVKKVIETV